MRPSNETCTHGGRRALQDFGSWSAAGSKSMPPNADPRVPRPESVFGRRTQDASQAIVSVFEKLSDDRATVVATAARQSCLDEILGHLLDVGSLT